MAKENIVMRERDMQQVSAQQKVVKALVKVGVYAFLTALPYSLSVKPIPSITTNTTGFLTIRKNPPYFYLNNISFFSQTCIIIAYKEKRILVNLTKILL